MAGNGCGTRTRKLAGIKADIAAHLGNHELSLDWLAERHGLRPRQIQNLFYAEGSGFSAFVLDCRLSHAHTLLIDPANASRTIIQIATLSGFGDISWFNNAFRRRFGMTPSESRAAAAELERLPLCEAGHARRRKIAET